MTTTEQEGMLREGERAFFGEVAASISHELNNTVTITNQAGGLLEDLIAECTSDQTINMEEVRWVADRIAKQTKRGTAIIMGLNAFAHSVSEPEKALEINALLRSVVALDHRLGERKRIQIRMSPGKRRLTIKNRSFRVQQALHRAIREVVSVAPAGSTVSLSAALQDSTVRICVEGERDAAAKEIDLSFLEVLTGQINGEIKATVKEGRICVRLSFPGKNASGPI